MQIAEDTRPRSWRVKRIIEPASDEDIATEHEGMTGQVHGHDTSLGRRLEPIP